MEKVLFPLFACFLISFYYISPAKSIKSEIRENANHSLVPFGERVATAVLKMISSFPTHGGPNK